MLESPRWYEISAKPGAVDMRGFKLLSGSLFYPANTEQVKKSTCALRQTFRLELRSFLCSVLDCGLRQVAGRQSVRVIKYRLPISFLFLEYRDRQRFLTHKCK